MLSLIGLVPESSNAKSSTKRLEWEPPYERALPIIKCKPLVGNTTCIPLIGIAISLKTVQGNNQTVLVRAVAGMVWVILLERRHFIKLLTLL